MCLMLYLWGDELLASYSRQNEGEALDEYEVEMSCVVRINLVSGLILALAKRSSGGADLRTLEALRTNQ